MSRKMVGLLLAASFGPAFAVALYFWFGTSNAAAEAETQARYQTLRSAEKGAAGREWIASFAYQRFAVGSRLDQEYYAQRYVIADTNLQGLPPAYGHHRWVRHYSDALLVDLNTGTVRDVLRGFFR